jgi:hypothetical protein
MRNDLYEIGDGVKTPEGNGFITQDQKIGETTVFVELANQDGEQGYDVDDIELI